MIMQNLRKTTKREQNAESKNAKKLFSSLLKKLRFTEETHFVRFARSEATKQSILVK
ncbi:MULTISPECIES: hypothetical protein [unclassified Helicobacter]|uniref:hypothetical protein n=1 Tax=unclassified Helicobacter TaxID=2593540 RepID=UPI0012E76CC6|nr:MULTISPECIES: hypothetical protein [unclassified Helicobacter]